MASMKSISAKIHSIFLKNRLTLAAAESCTGGLISKLITDNPGSSKFFLMGIVCYSNASKQKILKIPAKLIKDNGAVSKEVAASMAINVRKISGANFGIGITGIAGPEGGTKIKPVGTVFISVARDDKVVTKGLSLSGNRNKIRTKTAEAALKLLFNSLHASIYRSQTT